MILVNIPTPFLCIVLLLLMHCGCSFGPQNLKQGHLSYNASVKASADEELLLNIVRLRYLDTIEFLATNSISAQTSLSVSLGARLGTDRSNSTSLVIPELAFSDRPTFTFTPQRGREFARRLTEPVDINTFAYLAASDWPIHLLLILLGSEINGIVNDPGGNVAAYNSVANKLWQLQNDGDLLIGFLEREAVVSDPIDASRIKGSDLLNAAESGYRFRHAQGQQQFYLTKQIAQPVMWIAKDNHDAKTLQRILRLSQTSIPPYDIEVGSGLYQPEDTYLSIVLRTRSLLGAIVYLSQAVNPPAEHLKQGIATPKWPLPGFDDVGIASTFKVLASSIRPEASLAVTYRGYWFYIDETDMTSKATFLVMAEFYRLAISEGRPDQVPILTLPVGGP
jgi:hypothetical protein